MAKKKIDKVFLDNTTLFSLKYNEKDKDGVMRHLICEFSNGATLYDPIEVALVLYELTPALLSKNEQPLSKNVMHNFRDKIDWATLIYALTGGEETWQNQELNLKWDEESALEYWKPDLEEAMKDAGSIYDLIRIFHYFKYDFVLNHFSAFALTLNKI